MSVKQAFITGIGGQDGTLLTKFLLGKKYEVYGILSENKSYNSLANFAKADLPEDSIKWIRMDEIKNVGRPGCEIYNLAGQSSVGLSWDKPLETLDANTTLFVKLLESCKDLNAKILQASSVEIFGDVSNQIITEETEVKPLSPYAVSKAASFMYAVMYRNSTRTFVSNAILGNHESNIRDDKFVVPKIVNHVRKVRDGNSGGPLQVGNLDVFRDWGYAPEYVEGMWRILQLQDSDDFILATGVTISLQDFINSAFEQIDIKLEWEGEGMEQKAFSQDGQLMVEVREEFFRAADIQRISLDISKLKQKTNWTPETYGKALVTKLMI